MVSRMATTDEPSDPEVPDYFRADEDFQLSNILDAESVVNSVLSGSNQQVYLTEENRLGTYDLASIRAAQQISNAIDRLTEAIKEMNEEN